MSEPLDPEGPEAPESDRPPAEPAARTRWVRAIPFVMALIAVGAVAYLLSRPEPVPTQDELTQQLVTSGVEADTAACASGAIIDNLSQSELEVLVERGGGAAPVDDPDKTDDSADRVREALSDCRVAVTPTSSVPVNDERTTTTAVAPTATTAAP